MNKTFWNPAKIPVEQYILQVLEHLPVVSFYVRSRGWTFVIAWIHRMAGIFLILYICVHIYTLSLLAIPLDYESKMTLFGSSLFVLLEWLLAIPVIFHALNGGRLVLYEIFGSRNEETMIRWVFGISIVYFLLVGLLMMMGNQSVSPIFFWLINLILSVTLAGIVASRIWKMGGSVGWKLQRITGAYLLTVIPAHLLFMHLQPSAAHDSGVVIARMQSTFIKLVDLTLVIGVLYHAGYGLVSICKDYLQSKILQDGLAVLITFWMAVFGWMGIKLTILI